MKKLLRRAALNGAFGLVIGAAFGVLAGGALATWRVGGDVAQVDFLSLYNLSPLALGVWTPAFELGAMIAGGIAIVCMIAAAALAFIKPLDSHGSARWATKDELKKAGLAQPLKEIRHAIFGKLGGPGSSAAFVTTDAPTHYLLSAPTGAGKGVGVVIPTLLSWKGSVVVLDVKGENFDETARHRRNIGDKVFKFAPYDPEGRTHRFNPLDDIAAMPARRRFTEARRLAAALISAKSKGAEGFLEGAREIFAAGVLHVIEKGRPTIGAVYDCLAQPGQTYEIFSRLARDTESKEARSIFDRMSAQDSRILSSYLSVLADGGLSLWADPAVRDATAASDFRLDGLRREPASLYVVVSPNDLEPLAPLVRLLFQQTIAVMQRAKPGKGESFPVLFLLDEFASLGRMDILSQAITTLRGYGGRVMIVVQSLANLRGLYGPEGASNFMANCGVQLFMRPADADTPDYISKAIGDFTRKSRSKSWSMGEWGKTNISERAEGARLIRPEELRRLDPDTVVMLSQDAAPARIERVRYYEDKQLKALHAAQKGPMPEPEALVAGEGNPFWGGQGSDEAHPVVEEQAETQAVEIVRAESETASEPRNSVRGFKAKASADDVNEEVIASRQADWLCRIQAAKGILSDAQREPEPETA